MLSYGLYWYPVLRNKFFKAYHKAHLWTCSVFGNQVWLALSAGWRYLKRFKGTSSLRFSWGRIPGGLLLSAFSSSRLLNWLLGQRLFSVPGPVRSSLQCWFCEMRQARNWECHRKLTIVYHLPHLKNGFYYCCHILLRSKSLGLPISKRKGMNTLPWMSGGRERPGYLRSCISAW